MINIRFAFSLAFLLPLAVSSGCRGPASPTSPTPGLPSADASIFATVVRQLATKDDTFGGTLKPPKLFIIRSTNDSAGNPTSSYPPTSILIPQEVQNEITTNLSDLPGIVVWIDNFQDAFVASENTTRLPEKVKDGGVIITLGNIYRQANGSIQIAGSIWIGNMASGGSTYLLQKEDGGWTITGTTGPRWIS